MASVRSIGDSLVRAAKRRDRSSPVAMAESVKRLPAAVEGRRQRTWYMVARAPDP